VDLLPRCASFFTSRQFSAQLTDFEKVTSFQLALSARLSIPCLVYLESAEKAPWQFAAIATAKWV